MQTQTVVGIGELLWDCFGSQRRPGGAPANVAFHASQLGLGGLVVSRVGTDAHGDALVNELSSRGLSTGMLQRDAVYPTGRVTVQTEVAHQPSYTIHENVAWDHLVFDESLAAVARKAAIICFGTLAQRSPVARDTICRFVDAGEGALLVYDVNLRPPWYARDVIEASLQRCHVVKLNDEEVTAVSDLLELDVRETEAFASAVRERFDIQIVCVTRGALGCFVQSSDQSIHVPGRSADVADSVGAGDAFTAGFACGLLRNWSLHDVAAFANELGASAAEHSGAMPDLRATLETLPGRLASLWKGP